MTDTPQHDAAALGLDDIKAAVEAIDLAASTGAFKGWDEIAKVFTIREKMVRFLNAAYAHQKEQAQAQEQAHPAEPAPAAPNDPAAATTGQA